MTEKEELIYQQIINYYKKNKYMPTIRELLKELNYKSTNTIYKYIKQLENKGYLIRNKNNKLIIKEEIDLSTRELINITIINTKEVLILNLNKNKKYLGYKIKHDYFKHLYIKNQDYLIIERTNKLNNHDLGLFVINKKYRIMEYEYRDGFYLLKDFELITLYRVKIIGKVISVYRGNLN